MIMMRDKYLPRKEQEIIITDRHNLMIMNTCKNFVMLIVKLMTYGKQIYNSTSIIHLI